MGAAQMLYVALWRPGVGEQDVYRVSKVAVASVDPRHRPIHGRSGCENWKVLVQRLQGNAAVFHFPSVRLLPVGGPDGQCQEPLRGSAHTSMSWMHLAP